MFGSEEAETIVPALDQARTAGIDAHGPFGADTMYLDKSFDAYVVMYHDQGHIPAKLVGFDGTAAFAIGTPVLFSSVGARQRAGHRRARQGKRRRADLGNQTDFRRGNGRVNANRSR